MAKVAVKVKWQKEKYDVEVMLDEPAEVFKTQVRRGLARSHWQALCGKHSDMRNSMRNNRVHRDLWQW